MSPHHPTAGWTIQQSRNGLPLDAAYRFLVHDRDSIFSPGLDEAVSTEKSVLVAAVDVAADGEYAGWAMMSVVVSFLPTSEHGRG
jgi:hypothetical protein